MTLDFDSIDKGTELPELERGPLTELQFVRYAGASGDFNPIHVVPRVAQFVGLDGVIAHGMLVMAYATTMLTDWAGVGAVRRLKVRFSDTSHPGEELVCRGRVTGKETVDGENLVHGKLTVKGKADDSLKLKGDFTVVVGSR
ncbi:MAG: hypothetical protein GYB64_14235 [Chloroflexi bacterium]|nr:hypothetical protein [Chloroflexota bacterium]